MIQEAWRKVVPAGWAVVALVLFGATGRADTNLAEELEVEHSLSTDFVTPHTPWAKPYAGGKVRALFLLNIRYCGTVPREVVELKQRFDLDAEVVFWAKIVDSTKEHWHGDAAGEARMRRLLEKPWDCFVSIGLPLDRMGLEEQYRMLEAVTKGAGLVLMGVNDPRVMKPNRKLPTPPFLESSVPYLGLPFVRKLVLDRLPPETRTPAEVTQRFPLAYQIKAGRGVWLPARPDIEYRPGWETEYDYWQFLVGRAILWAAAKEPKATLDITMGAPALERAMLPREEGIVISWRDAPSAESLALAVRGETGFAQSIPDRAVTAAQGQASAPLPSLPAGQYYVDAILRGKQGVITWASAPFQVTCPRAVKEIVLDKSFSEIGGDLTGRVLVEGAPALPDERVRVEILDRRNRVLLRYEAECRNSAVGFSFPVAEWMPMLVRVEATLLSGEEPAATTYAYFNVVKRNRGQFNFLMWDFPTGTLGAYGMQSLADLGVTLVLSGGPPPRHVLAYDAAWVPYTTHVDAHHDDKGIMKPCCWNDEPAITKHVDAIVAKRVPDRQAGVFVYSLGDEIATRGSCLHPACLAAFRSYLRDEYKTIEALNVSWGSAYADFDQVALDPPDDDNANVAKAKGNYPRWYDRQAFQCYNFTRLCKRFVDGFAALDPQARVGFEGAGSFDAGDDYDLIVRTNGFWSPYPGLGDEIIRSIAPRDFPRANWMGYTKDADSLLSKYWRMVTRGCDSVWWWRWDGVARFHGFLAPHLGPYQATAEIFKDTQIVRDGLGTLLIHSTMLDDGIAILYSLPSAYAARVEQGPAYGGYASTHEAWSRILRELGLQYRYVTDRMLRRGEFKASEFKVVLLPHTDAIGPEEAAILRQFVQDGGTLIADVRPGIADGHCKPQPKGALDDVFGIARSAGDSKPEQGEAALGEGAQELKIANALCDPAVSLAGGQAAGRCGKVPLAISHPFGKGHAVLLNLAVTSFPALKLPDTPRAADGFMNGLLAGAGIEAKVRLLDEQGERARNVEIGCWRNGDSLVLSLFRETGEPSKARMVLPGEMHVYDLRNRKYLGLTKTVETDIIPCRATFFALTPAEVQPVELSLEPAALARGLAGKASLRSKIADGVSAVLVTATMPDGKEADWLRRVVMVPPAGGDVPLPIAFNDPAGDWRIRAVELFSSKATDAALSVK